MGIVKLDGYSCDRCGHQWMPRSKIDELPIICPKCKSPYWNIPRKNELEQARHSMQKRKKGG